ncbi:MAG: DUF1028 domain-containing protein [Burkholderiales bacterium]
MTFSIIARCPSTGQLGLAAASYSVAIGLYSDNAIRENTGVALTQGFPNPRNNRLAIHLLAQGHAPSHVLAELLANDADGDFRQIALVNREDVAVAHSGSKLRPWAGHRIGKGYVTFGDMLAGEKVIDAMATAFEGGAGKELDERLLAALEAGRDAGGIVGKQCRLPERSAALTVWGNRRYNEIDLRVDLHDRAIDDLKRIYIDYKPSVAYYEARAKSPRNAIPAMEFADMLKKQKATT